MREAHQRHQLTAARIYVGALPEPLHQQQLAQHRAGHHTWVHRTPKLRPLVRELFESLEASEEAARDLHWSPSEKEHRSHPKADRDLTDLEHWFQFFSDTRNEILHEGAEPDLVYAEEGSAYQGSYPQIAQQILREAIRAFVTVHFGYKNLWRSTTYRKLAAIFGEDDGPEFFVRRLVLASARPLGG